MGPSVPDGGSRRGVGVAERGWRGRGLPLSARQGANGPIGGGSATRTSACTDISPTSLHNGKRRVRQCTKRYRRPFSTEAHPRSAELRWSDRKSTRLNSSHGYISYAVFCLKKK